MVVETEGQSMFESGRVWIIIGAVILLNFAVMFIVRARMKAQMRSQMNDSVNNAVTQYFALPNGNMPE